VATSENGYLGQSEQCIQCGHEYLTLTSHEEKEQVKKYSRTLSPAVEETNSVLFDTVYAGTGSSHFLTPAAGTGKAI
jgi:hypothetical protein